MNRKHFKMLAEILREHWKAGDETGNRCPYSLKLVRDVAAMCEGVNPNFNYDRFIEAVTEED